MRAGDSEKKKETENFSGHGDSHDDGGDFSGVRGDGVEEKAVSCSICLEIVIMEGDRSIAKLQCGHVFHLDCIGSAFNVKGAMQCPNCRKIEKGNWLYSNGFIIPPEVSMDEWAQNDLYEIAYPEGPFRLHWCPFSRLAHVLSSYEEGDSSPQAAFQDFLGHHAMFADQVTVSAATNSSYVAYLRLLHPSSLSVARASLMEGHSQWNHMAAASDGLAMQAIHPMEFHYNHLTDYLHPSHSREGNRVTIADQTAVPRGTLIGQLDSDMLSRGINTGYHLSYFHSNAPQLHGDSPGYHFSYLSRNGSISRPRNTSSFLPQFMPAAFMHGQSNIWEHFPQTSPSIFAAMHRSRASQVLGSSSPLQSEGPILSPSMTMGAEDIGAGGTQFYAWERDRLAPYPLMPVEFGMSWWGSPQSHVAAAATADSDQHRSWWHSTEIERPSLQTTSDSSNMPHMHSFM